MSDMPALSALSSTTATSSAGGSKKGSGSWYEAMAEAWGEALDKQANTIVEMGSSLEAGDDTPSRITQLTAESLRMGFLSNSSHTSLTSVASALETMARKQ